MAVVGQEESLGWLLFLSPFVRMKCLFCVAADQISDSLCHPPLWGTLTLTPTAPPPCWGGPRRGVWLLSGMSPQRWGGKIQITLGTTKQICSVHEANQLQGGFWIGRTWSKLLDFIDAVLPTHSCWSFWLLANSCKIMVWNCNFVLLGWVFLKFLCVWGFFLIFSFCF